MGGRLARYEHCELLQWYVAGESARSGSRYEATNTSTSGGGIYQDVAGLNMKTGDTFARRHSYELSTRRPRASGRLRWMVGGTNNENGTANYRGVGNATKWTQKVKATW